MLVPLLWDFFISFDSFLTKRWNLQGMKRANFISQVSLYFFFLLYSQFCCLSSCASETGLETGIYKSYGRFCAVCRFQVEELLSAMIFTSLRIMTETLTDITYIQGAVSDQWGKSSCLDSLKHEVILHLRSFFVVVVVCLFLQSLLLFLGFEMLACSLCLNPVTLPYLTHGFSKSVWFYFNFSESLINTPVYKKIDFWQLFHSTGIKGLI